MITQVIINSNTFAGKGLLQKIKDNPSDERMIVEEFSNPIPQGYITIDEFDQATTKMINDLFSSNDQSFIQRKSKKGLN